MALTDNIAQIDQEQLQQLRSTAQTGKRYQGTSVPKASTIGQQRAAAMAKEQVAPQIKQERQKQRAIIQQAGDVEQSATMEMDQISRRLDQNLAKLTQQDRHDIMRVTQQADHQLKSIEQKYNVTTSEIVGALKRNAAKMDVEKRKVANEYYTQLLSLRNESYVAKLKQTWALEDLDNEIIFKEWVYEQEMGSARRLVYEEMGVSRKIFDDAYAMREAVSSMDLETLIKLADADIAMANTQNMASGVSSIVSGAAQAGAQMDWGGGVEASATPRVGVSSPETLSETGTVPGGMGPY